MPEVQATGRQLYQEHVNPQWARLLELLGMDVRYRRCQGVELTTEDGVRILDFLSGYCVYNAGHNHPKIIESLREELSCLGPAMLQSHIPELAGELAGRLCASAGGKLERVFFTSSGSEGVETAIKFSRAYTGRNALLYAEGGFHGLTCGALSLMSNRYWKEGFGSFLEESRGVPFGDLASLERELSTRSYAMFITEPIQGEAGIRVPPADYLQSAERLCRKFGTAFVVDEVQTGLYRTGTFLAGQQYGIHPDMVILAKAMSGGLVPCGAVLMTREVNDAVYTSVKKAIVHTSTFSENALAMRAAMATLDVLEEEHLGEHAAAMGAYLRERLTETLARYEMFHEVRGLGLFCGIAFQPPHQASLRIPFQAFRAIHPGMFGQMVVMRMFRHEHILTQVCGNDFMVLKCAPPLLVTAEQADEFVTALDRTMAYIHTSGAFWKDALALAGRAIRI